MESDYLYLTGARYFQLKGSCEHSNEFLGFRCLRKRSKKHPLASSRPSVCPHVSVRLIINGFP